MDHSDHGNCPGFSKYPIPNLDLRLCLIWIGLAVYPAIMSSERPKLFGMTMGEWGAALIVLGVLVVLIEGLLSGEV